VASLQAVRRQLRGTAERLLEYGMLRWLGPQEVRERLAGMAKAEVAFNYLGQWDSLGSQAAGLLRPSERMTGMGRAAEEVRPHLVDINAMVVGGRLAMDWSYSPLRHRRDTVARWADRFLELLREVVRGDEK
jgi:non-ribosomal peptide synthase protein (TIGR01720 family)